MSSGPSRAFHGCAVSFPGVRRGEALRFAIGSRPPAIPVSLSPAKPDHTRITPGLASPRITSPRVKIWLCCAALRSHARELMVSGRIKRFPPTGKIFQRVRSRPRHTFRLCDATDETNVFNLSWTSEGTVDLSVLKPGSRSKNHPVQG